MKDAIDKRNEREKIAKSIVKRWNVIYISKEELEQKRREEEHMQQMEEERQKADEILKRLEREAREDEEKKAEELRLLLAQQEIESHKSSDMYGTTPMDGVTQEKVEAILNDKERVLQQIIQNTETVSARDEVEEVLRQEFKEDNTTAEADNEEEAVQIQSEDVPKVEKEIEEQTEMQ